MIVNFSSSPIQSTLLKINHSSLTQANYKINMGKLRKDKDIISALGCKNGGQDKNPPDCGRNV
jgi:hypothetical protein